MTPNFKNSFEIGCGYASSIGVRARTVWKRPWVNKYGHSVENSFNLSKSEQFISMNYKIPLLNNPLEEYYLLQGGWLHNDSYNVQSYITTLNIARYWNYVDSWQRVINIHFYINHDIQQANLSKILMLVCPSISINRIQQYGNVLPFCGNSQRYSINFFVDFWKPNINFIVLQAQRIWIRKFFERNRVLLRSSISWMKKDNLSYYVPMPVRFFFNKDRVIRGYKYQPILYSDYFKYTKLIINTVEYQYNIFGKLWSAIFLDFGEVDINFSWKHFKFGAGMSVCWFLPIGPIKLDIAIPLMYKFKMNHNFLHFYVNLGPEL